jgi:rare lipoprotein A (peptidoglycan hydrolase)
MSMRRLVGIFLAWLVTSACAIDKTPEESTSPSPGDPARFPQAKGETPTDQFSVFAGGPLMDGASSDNGSEQVARRFARVEPATDSRGRISDPCCTPLHRTGISLSGKAAWYNLVGRKTASGEILDTITATAAHRSLPLVSYAKVTNLNNGRFVVVRINDRGPYTPGRILDLSPRAADALDMKRVGVAAVLLEPLVNLAGQATAVFQPSVTAVLQ